MSKYINFDRCVVCRSKANLKLYSEADGPFEVTMLLNSLYLTVMHYIEKRKRIIKRDGERIPVDESLAKWLEDNKIIYSSQNVFTPAEILRNLRNGLAHFNMKDFESQGHVNEITIGSHMCRRKVKDGNQPAFKKFDYRNGDAKITNAVCVFTFSVEQLNTFAKMVMDAVLSGMPDECCKECLFKGDIKCQP